MGVGRKYSTVWNKRLKARSFCANCQGQAKAFLKTKEMDPLFGRWCKTNRQEMMKCLSYFVFCLREYFQTRKCRKNRARIWNQNSGGNNERILKSALFNQDQVPRLRWTTSSFWKDSHFDWKANFSNICIYRKQWNVGNLEIDKCPNFLKRQLQGITDEWFSYQSSTKF